MATINNATVKTRFEHASKFGQIDKYFLDIIIPLPGGKAVYEIEVDEKIVKNIEQADALSTKYT